MSQVGVFLCFFGHLYQTLRAIPMIHFFGSSFFWKLGCDLHLRALEWLSSISGAKIMGQKTKIGKNFCTHKR